MRMPGPQVGGPGMSHHAPIVELTGVRTSRDEHVPAIAGGVPEHPGVPPVIGAVPAVVGHLLVPTRVALEDHALLAPAGQVVARRMADPLPAAILGMAGAGVEHEPGAVVS